MDWLRARAQCTALPFRGECPVKDRDRKAANVSKLTKTVVEAAVPRDEPFTIWCGDLRGFGVYVLPTARRT